MDLSSNIFFNSIDVFATFNMYANQNFYSELLKAPQVTTYTKDWADENGTERDFTTKEYQPKTMDLPFFMKADTDNDLLANYNLLKTFFQSNSTFFLKVYQMDRSFNVKYRSMPSFQKLTKFKDNNNVCVSFNLTLTELVSFPYLDFNGDEITLTYPPDVDVDTIDFNEFDFEIVDKHLLMTGDVDFANGNILNGNDLINTYGIYLDQNSYSELLGFADQKNDIDLVFETRNISLPLILIADDEEDFYIKWWSFTAFVLDKGYFNLDVRGLIKRFKLCYSDMPTVQKLTLFKDNTNKVAVKFIVNLFDDEPTVEGGLTIFDGQFQIVGNYLIYTQSDEFDSQIDFDITDKDLIVEIF